MNFLTSAVLMVVAIAIIFFAHLIPLRRIFGSGNAKEGASRLNRVLLTRSSWSIEGLIAIAVLVLPTGAVLHVISAHLLGFCRGAMGSGVTCQAGILSRYLEEATVAFEVSIIFFGAGLGWAAGNLTMIGASVFCLAKAVSVR